ncbi:hypothetical protein TWF718_003103 [Orbilia javanica]|uniref:Nucleoside phosphorylase domain-containing protein n=1 Tax=Orbilia javanica TaxID=47235 RepID=A0AAN8RJC5_9PEZI
MRAEDFTVGWICAIGPELSAIYAVLDEEYDKLRLPIPINDKNIYGYGQIAGHNVVFTCPPSMGTIQAGIAAARMSVAFPNLRFILMVGIAGGAPSKKNDVRLGDIVVSKRDGSCSGVIQYDFGKSLEGGKFKMTGSMGAPPQVLVSAAISLAHRERGKINEDVWNTYKTGKTRRNKDLEKEFEYPGQNKDILFKPDALHACDSTGAAKESCEDCTDEKVQKRDPKLRPNEYPRIHYGIVASGNRVMKDGEMRDEIIRNTAAQVGAEPLCFEMEAAGLVSDFDCMVIRGICDYSDGHKNKEWQSYAAIIAAIYAKELLGRVSPVISAGLVADAKETLSSIPSRKVDFIFQYSMPFHIPFPRNTNFSGRDEILDDIHKCFTKPRTHNDIPSIFAITSTGGMGKSQVALEYAYQHLSDYTSVFWVSAATEKTIHASFIKIMERIAQEHARVLWGDSVGDYEDIGQKLKLDGLIDDEGRIATNPQYFGQIRSAFFIWLELKRPRPDERWLLIIDNADDLDACAFHKLGSLPTRGNGAILITSRRPEIRTEGLTEKRELEVLEKEAAVGLLLGAADLENSQDAIKEQAAEIVIELGFLPLAISQAGNYIKQTKIGINDYLRLYREDFMKVQSIDPGLDYDCQVTTTTWEASLQAIQKQDEDAALILFVSAYFNPKEICESIWVDCNDERYRTRFRKHIALLASYSLIKVTNEATGIFSVHPVIQTWIRECLKRDGQTDALRDAIILLGKVSKWKSLSHTSRKWAAIEERRFLSHTRHLGSHITPNSFIISTTEAIKPVGDNLYLAFANIGYVLEKQERYADALPWLERALAGLQLGRDAFEKLPIIGSIGNCLNHERKFEQAEKLFLINVDMYPVQAWRCLPQPPLPPTGVEMMAKNEKLSQWMNNLGTTFYRQWPCLINQTPNKLELALYWYNLALTVSQHLGVRDTLRYEIRHNRSKVYRQMNFEGTNKECGALIEELRAWGMGCKMPVDVIKYFDSATRIASIFEDLGNFDMAKNWYMEAVTLRVEGFDENHPRRIKAFRRLGRCWSALGNHNEALKDHGKALAGFKALNGEDCRDGKYFYMLNKIVGCYRGDKNYDKAVEVSLEILSDKEKLFGRKDDKTFEAMRAVSKNYYKLKKYDEALRYALELYELRKEVYEPDDVRIAESMNDMAKLYAESGDVRQAIDWYGRALSGFSSKYSSTDRRTRKVAGKIDSLRDGTYSSRTAPSQAGWGQGGYNQGGYQNGYNQAGYNQAGNNQTWNMNQPGNNQSWNMNQTGYGQAVHNQAGYSQTGYPSNPVSPQPQIVHTPPYTPQSATPAQPGYQMGQPMAHPRSPPPANHHQYASGPMVGAGYNQVNYQGGQYYHGQSPQGHYVHPQYPHGFQPPYPYQQTGWSLNPRI